MALLWNSTKINILNVIERILNAFIKLLGPVLLLMVIFIFGLVIYSFFNTLLPMELEGFSDDSILKMVIYIVQSALSLYLVVLILYNYYNCLTISPGTINRQKYLRWKKIDDELRRKQNKEENNQDNITPIEAIPEQGTSSSFNENSNENTKENVALDINDEKKNLLNNNDTIINLDEEIENLEDFPDYSNMYICKKCDLPKPPRTHHCRMCNTCQLKMDHHCPWVNNCIGYNNHRYFVLFLQYLFIGNIYYSILSIKPIIAIVIKFKKRVPPKTLSELFLFFTILLNLALIFSVGMLYFWHLYLLLTNQTTIEYSENQYYKKEAKKTGDVYVNEFDLGYKTNFKMFFNISKKYPWWTMLLPMRVQPFGDGINFPSVLDSMYMRELPPNAVLIKH